MADAGIGGSDLSQCAEGNWSCHPIGGIFRATKDLDCETLYFISYEEELC